MSGQRHRIRRQVLEIVLQDQGSAWELSAELSRIQRASLMAIIDQCCTEVGDPDRLHRIESLEVDLGHIHAGNLEHELIERLGPRLREALATRVRAEDQVTSMAGVAGPEAISRLELVAFFAKTGNLPWWADASRPRVLDEAVAFLLQHAGRSLVVLVRRLAHSERELRRLIIHCDEERLWALFDALAASAPHSLAPRTAELRDVLTALPMTLGVLPSTFRNAVWVAVLRTASTEGNAGKDAASFWRGALAQVALDLGVTYSSLVMSLHETSEPRRLVATIVQRLYREVRGETVADDTVLRGSDDETHGAKDIEAIVERLDLLSIEPSALLRVLDEFEASVPAEDLREVRSVLRAVIEGRRDDSAAHSEAPDDIVAVEALVDQIERTKLLPTELASELRARARRATARERSILLQVLEQLDAMPPASRSVDVIEELQRLLREQAQEPKEDSDAPAAHGDAPGEGALEELLDQLERAKILPKALSRERSILLRSLEAWKHLRQSGRLSARALERVLEELERPAASSPTQALGEIEQLVRNTMAVEISRSAESPPLDLAYGDSENAYVENAGLVILWPFLGHLFERLELTADKQFKDSAAQHRAVGVLQHLATQDAWPEEYQLLLAKVLCGMQLDQVIEFGPPITAAEAEESADLLRAVIANAPILKDMSIDGFRGSFLLRKGILGARDGTWLLRVERATHDVVLERFPWGLSWVKLPWMEAPISVEW